MAKLAKAVVLLLQAGWSAAFVAMYDEVWELCAALGGLMAAVSGGNANNFDFLAWFIDPREAAGFAPHRDRQPAGAEATGSTIPKFFSLCSALMSILPFRRPSPHLRRASWRPW